MPKSETICEKMSDFSIEEACKSNNLLSNLITVVKSHPDDSAKQLGLSILFLIQEEHGKMLDCLNILARKFPEVASLHRRIAEVYINQGDFVTAVPHLEKALKLNNHDMTAKIWLGLSYYATGNKKAETCLSLLKSDVFLLHAANVNWFKEDG